MTISSCAVSAYKSFCWLLKWRLLVKQLLKNGSENMKNCLNIGKNLTFLYQSSFRHFILIYIRYTRRDPDYNSTVLRASNPAPPPVMANWPPVSRGRRPWYVYYNIVSRARPLFPVLFCGRPHKIKREKAVWLARLITIVLPYIMIVPTMPVV